MNRTMKKTLLAFVFLFACSYLNGQELAGKVVLKKPFKYFEPYADINYSETEERDLTREWIVYSDRISNKSYDKPGSTTVKKSLGFLERFLVLDETDKYIHIVKDPNVDIHGTLSKSATDFGWISKDKMLLWEHCLFTRVGKIDKKAMVLNTVEGVKRRDINKDEPTEVFFCTDPGLNKKSENSTSLYEVFFIYKQTKDAVLLGRLNRKSGSLKMSDVVVGWIPNTRINFWDHRIALEPNPEVDAVKERKSKGIKTTILLDELAAEDFMKGRTVRSQDVFWNADTYEERPDGYWRRFPILNYDKESGMYHTGVMGEIHSSKGVLDQITKAGADRQIAELITKKRTINIVFVIDGTKSMQPYFKPVSDAIISSMKKLKELNKNELINNIQFGAVVYRDYAEDQKRRLTEPFMLTSDNIKISEWLLSRKAIDYHDTDAPEAVYYGLQKALYTILSRKELETNVIILIGDAGNHHRNDGSQVSETDLVSLLELYGCHFLAFQVNNESGHTTYDEFVPQTKNIILKTAEEIYADLKKLPVNLSKFANKPKFISAGHNRDTLNKTAIIGLVVYPDKGKSISTTVLQKEIMKTINYVYNYMNDYVSLISEVFAQGENVDKLFTSNSQKKTRYTNKEVSAFTDAILYYLTQLDISEDQIKILCDKNYQLYIDGWTPYKLDNFKNPLFQRVLFVSRGELGDLINIMDKLASAKSGSRRQKLYDTWIEILKDHVGDVNEEELEEMTFEEIYEKVFGLPGTSELLKDTKLKYLKDRGVVSDEDIERYSFRIDSKYDKLNSIFHEDNYIYSFRSNEMVYYWLPEHLLP